MNAPGFVKLTDSQNGSEVFMRPDEVAFVARPSGVHHNTASTRIGLKSGGVYDVRETPADVLAIIQRGQ